MGYDRGDSFPLDFEPDGFPFDSKSKGKLSPRSDPIQFERKLNTCFLSVGSAVRGTGVSQGGPTIVSLAIGGPPVKPPCISTLYRIEGFEGAHNHSPIIPRQASRTAARLICVFFQSGLHTGKCFRNVMKSN